MLKAVRFAAEPINLTVSPNRVCLPTVKFLSDVVNLGLTGGGASVEVGGLGALLTGAEADDPLLSAFVGTGGGGGFAVAFGSSGGNGGFATATGKGGIFGAF